MRRLGPRGLVAALLPVLWLGVASCDDTGDVDPLAIDAAGKVKGQLFLDLNGTGQADGGDQGAEGFTLALEQPAGGRRAAIVTDTGGRVVFEDVPVGRWVVRVNEAELGDTLEAFGLGLDAFELSFADSVSVLAGLTYKTYTLSEARELAVGKPLFAYGIALNQVSSTVRELHVKSGDEYLRVTGLLGGFAQPGDSVRVRGRTSRDAGQPVLISGAVFPLSPTGVVPEPVSLTTAEADQARGGELDAALVQVNLAEILEVELLDDDGVRLLVDDGSGELEIVYRAFLNVNPNDFRPDTVFVDRARGLLVPYADGGDTRWRLLPRARSDVRTETRTFPPAAAAAPLVVGASTTDVAGVQQGRRGRGEARNER